MNKTPTAPASGKTSVVIPYYQEEPGILRGAVMSAIAQEGVSDLEIIVIDDGSPAPARDDLGEHPRPHHPEADRTIEPRAGRGAQRAALSRPFTVREIIKKAQLSCRRMDRGATVAPLPGAK
jgi:cellulose synthase/poly-beta-1,6-N-acetylglucosamine synthase-like glycosyltransferase